MNKTITIYELLGLVKDEKQPKKVFFNNRSYSFDGADEDYIDEDEDCLFMNLFQAFPTNNVLNETVEIIEDNDKLEKINVKTGDNCKRFIEYDDETGHHKYTIRLLDEYFSKNINKIIDHINKIEEELNDEK